MKRIAIVLLIIMSANSQASTLFLQKFNRDRLTDYALQGDVAHANILIRGNRFNRDDFNRARSLFNQKIFWLGVEMELYRMMCRPSTARRLYVELDRYQTNFRQIETLFMAQIARQEG